MELWYGEERTCDHRRERHRGVCPLEREQQRRRRLRRQEEEEEAAAIGEERESAEAEAFGSGGGGSSVRGKRHAEGGSSRSSGGGGGGDAGGKRRRRAQSAERRMEGQEQEQQEEMREGAATSLVLEHMANSAAGVFGHTAFSGLAVFPRVAGLAKGTQPNVELCFEHAAPIATVRALCKIQKGTPLVLQL